MVTASPKSFRKVQIEALEELKRLNGTSIGGITIGIDIEKLEKYLVETKPPCDCLNCWILRNFYQPVTNL